jgi:hypothetical protein
MTWLFDIYIQRYYIGEDAGPKKEIPNLKHQIPNKSQALNSKQIPNKFQASN